ncbi:S9 family peptidase [soil metagenome]
MKLIKFCPSFLFIILLFSNSIFSQNKQEITLEDIFKNSIFTQKTVTGINWMKNGRYYTSLVTDTENGNDLIIQYEITTGSIVDTLVNGGLITLDDGKNGLRFSSYNFNENEDKILLASNRESIYRRSYIADYFIYNLNTKEIRNLSEGARQSYATFSPDGSKIAFVKENDLYYVNLEDMKEYRVTNTGKVNEIINGSTDWVYEEEFYLTIAFFWSPDGQKIAFYTFDESEVKEYEMQMWYGLYPNIYSFKYPKAGEKNSEVKISVFNVENETCATIQLQNNQDIYIPRITWTAHPDILSIFRLNRHQNHLEILHTNTLTDHTSIPYSEKSETYVDVNNNDKIIYLPDNKSFLFTSEKDGFKHIYHFDFQGKLIRQITSGAWEVDVFIGYDPAQNLIYYTSTEVSPLERHIYSIDLKGRQKKTLSSEGGTNTVNFSPDFRYYINYQSNIHQPLTVSLNRAPGGKLVRILENNHDLQQSLQSYSFGTTEFFTFSSDRTELNGYLVKPADFDASKKYPILMYVYGGPGDQRVNRSYYGTRELWHHYLTQKGYIIAVIDNRGTGGRGKDFRHVTYLSLGKYEAQDQIAGAQFLGTLPYVDNQRIGIWGWSYGGYLSSLSVLLGAPYFKAAIAVAPVTSWRFYDTIYTERYLRTPQENPEGYDNFSPLSHVEKLNSSFLLIHGTGDDNVHFQNAVEMQKALIEAGKQFESFYYPNKNHSISGGNTSLHLYEMMTKFIEKEL